MTQAHPAYTIGGASRDRERVAAALGLAKWLRLAATPTFAIMALLTGRGGSPMNSLCSSLHGVPLTGMVTMYLLMSAFHLPPWLNLICGFCRKRDRHVRCGPVDAYRAADVTSGSSHNRGV